MENLFDVYKKCISDGKWQYYQLALQGTEVLKDAEIGKAFITSYLGKGCKSKLQIFEYIQNLSDIRILHIVSCFFFGVALYNMSSYIRESIDSLLTQNRSNPKDAPEERFLYIWMLICLFHDLGYAVENGLVPLPKNEFNELMLAFPKRPKCLPKLYNKAMLKNYNKFRLCRFGVNDHGIVGGIKLYYDLCELREVKEKEDTHHFWGESLKKDFSLAAWTIACHNVFMVKKGDKNEKCYACTNLSSLIYNDQSREINLKEHSLLFLFCLIDTIEPIKIITDCKLLKKISIRIEDDKFSVDCSKLCNVLQDDYNKRIKGMREWLTDVNVDGSKKIVML